MFIRSLLIPLLVSVSLGSSTFEIHRGRDEKIEGRKKSASAFLEELQSSLRGKISELRGEISEFEDAQRKFNEFVSLDDAFKREEYETCLEIRALRQKRDKVEAKITELEESSLSDSEKILAIYELKATERWPLSQRISEFAKEWIEFS